MQGVCLLNLSASVGPADCSRLDDLAKMKFANLPSHFSRTRQRFGPCVAAKLPRLLSSGRLKYINGPPREAGLNARIKPMSRAMQRPSHIMRSITCLTRLQGEGALKIAAGSTVLLITSPTGTTSAGGVSFKMLRLPTRAFR